MRERICRPGTHAPIIGARPVRNLISMPRFSPFHANAFTWSFALGMTHLLIPLYARELGMSGVAIGSLISLPVLGQIWCNLLGGAYADRIGAKPTSLIACVLTMVAAAIFATSANYLGLLAGQVTMMLSRAAFWPSNWALASRLPGDRSRNMGRLNATTDSGNIVGVALTGAVIAQLGFRTGFWIMLGVGFLSFLFSIFIAPHPTTNAARPALFAIYRVLLKRRGIHFSVLCAYISALPVSLSVSFFPILLVEQGFSSQTTGLLLALRAVGSITAGFALAQLVRSAADRAPPLACALLAAVCVGLVALFPHPLWAGSVLLGLGLGSGLMTVYFQILISSVSLAEQRGSAMALGSLGYALSHLSAPLIVGSLADAYGIHAALYAFGLIVLMIGLTIPAVQRWAFRNGNRPL